MKCASCQSENPEGAKSCSECAAVPILNGLDCFSGEVVMKGRFQEADFFAGERAEDHFHKAIDGNSS